MRTPPRVCWLCDQPVVPPIEIVGRWMANEARIVHKQCLLRLGELELDFERADGNADPSTHLHGDVA